MTGAIRGLGPEYARQLANQGFNLCLIIDTDLNSEIFTDLQKDLIKINKDIQIEIIVVNFYNNNLKKYYREIKGKIDLIQDKFSKDGIGGEVSMLILNASEMHLG